MNLNTPGITIVNSNNGSTRTMIATDFDSFHGVKFSGVDRCYLYADGHIE